MQPVAAYISLGSNLGDRAKNLQTALRRVAGNGCAVQAVSDWIETAAVGMPAGSPPFLNGAAAVATTLSPRALLERLLQVEQSLGRVRTGGWTPRTIDLDLLLYGQLVVHEPGLTVPHPHMTTRLFVMQPLAQIAPDVVHPSLNQSLAELWQAFHPV